MLINCAKLENERSTLIYKVEDLKDLLEDQTELAAELKITLKSKCRDIEKLKMSVAQKTKDVEVLTSQVAQREDLLREKAGIIITQLGDIMEVCRTWGTFIDDFLLKCQSIDITGSYFEFKLIILN